MSLKSKESKVVFVAFMQHCIHSNVTPVTHVERVESVLCIQGLLLLQGGRLFIWKAFRLVGLALHHQSVQGGSFVNFLSTTRVIAFLKLRGHSAT